jgi:putative ABC transport system permease protein
VLGGIGATQIIASLAGWQTLLDPLQLLLAFVISVAVGVFFGYYPARTAARLDPIIALRYE